MVTDLLRSPVLATWVAAGIMLLNSVIAIPIVISTLKVEEINVFFLFFSIVALCQGAQFGFNGTFGRFVAYSWSGVPISEFKNIQILKERSLEVGFSSVELSKIVSLTRYVYNLIAGLFLVLMLTLGYYGLSEPIGLLEKPSEGWLSWTFIVFASTLVIYLGHFRIFLEGTGNVVIVQRILAAVNLGGLGAILFVLMMKPTLVAIVFVYQMVAMSSAIIIALIAKWRMDSLGNFFPKAGFERRLFSILWDSVWKSGITVFVASSVKHVSTILVAQWFPVGESASYQFTKRLFDVIENFTQITFQAKLPLLAGLRGQGDFVRLLPALASIQRISMSVCIIGFSVLLFFGNPILSLIGSNVPLGGLGLLVLFSLSTFFSRWVGFMLAISNQSNNVIEHKNAVIVACVFFPLLYFFNDLGVEIVPLSVLIALLFGLLFVIKEAYSSIHTSFFAYERSVTIPFFVILLAINLISYYLGVIQ